MKIEVHWKDGHIGSLPVGDLEQFEETVQKLLLKDSQFVTIGQGIHARRFDKGQIDHVRVWVI